MALPRVGWSYVLGVWIGRKYVEGFRTPALPWWIAAVLPVIGIMLVPSLPFSPATGDLLFVIAFLPLMMWCTAMTSPPTGVRPALEWLGNFSLPLYCVHLTVLVWAKELLNNSGQVAALAVVLACLLAWIFSKLVSFSSKPLPTKV